MARPSAALFPKLYEEGCPCFNRKDLDDLLSLTKLTDNCQFTETRFYSNGKLTQTRWDVYADFYPEANENGERNERARHFAQLDDFPSKDTANICGMHAFSSQEVPCLDPVATPPDGLCGSSTYDKETRAQIDDFLFSKCKGVLMVVKGKAKGLGCRIANITEG